MSGKGKYCLNFFLFLLSFSFRLSSSYFGIAPSSCLLVQLLRLLHIFITTFHFCHTIEKLLAFSGMLNVY